MFIKEESFLIKLGIKIRKLREKKNLSQDDLANDCEISKRQIGRIERAEINTSVKTLIKIANALDVQFVELFDF